MGKKHILLLYIFFGLFLSCTNFKNNSANVIKKEKRFHLFKKLFNSVILGSLCASKKNKFDIPKSSSRKLLQATNDTRCNFTITTIEQTNTDNIFSALQLNFDLPVIAYSGEINSNAVFTRLAVCEDIFCNNKMITLIDNDGFNPNLELAQGNPVIIYESDFLTNTLKLIICNDILCQSSIERTFPAFDIVYSLTLQDLNPVVSYRVVLIDDLGLIICDDSTCSSFENIVFNGTQIGANVVKVFEGNIRIAYFSTVQNIDSVLLINCFDTFCSSFIETLVFSIDFIFPAFIDMVIDSNGNSFITILSGPNINPQRDLIMIKCNNQICDNNDVIVLDSTGDRRVIWGGSIDLDSFQNPMIAYSFIQNLSILESRILKLISCSDQICSSKITYDVDQKVDILPSLKIFENRPSISYGALINNNITELRLAVCQIITQNPTEFPTQSPSINPSVSPSLSPTLHPSLSPSTSPTKNPTNPPTKNPTLHPTTTPTRSPSQSPSLPTNNPTNFPSQSPTNNTISPTQSPTQFTGLRPIAIVWIVLGPILLICISCICILTLYYFLYYRPNLPKRAKITFIEYQQVS